MCILSNAHGCNLSKCNVPCHARQLLILDIRVIVGAASLLYSIYSGTNIRLDTRRHCTSESKVNIHDFQALCLYSSGLSLNVWMLALCTSSATPVHRYKPCISYIGSHSGQQMRAISMVVRCLTRERIEK